MNDINLLGTRKKHKLGRTKQYLVWLNNVSLVLLILVTLSAIIVFLLTMLSPYQTLSKKAVDTTAQLNTQSSKAAKVYLIIDRTAAIKTLIAKRPDYHKYADVLLEVLPPNVSVEEFSIDKGALTFSASSDSLLSLDTFFSRFVGHVENKTYFKSVLLNNLLVDTKENKYKVSLIVGLL